MDWIFVERRVKFKLRTLPFGLERKVPAKFLPLTIEFNIILHKYDNEIINYKDFIETFTKANKICIMYMNIQIL